MLAAATAPAAEPAVWKCHGTSTPARRMDAVSAIRGTPANILDQPLVGVSDLGELRLPTAIRTAIRLRGSEHGAGIWHTRRWRPLDAPALRTACDNHAVPQSATRRRRDRFRRARVGRCRPRSTSSWTIGASPTRGVPEAWAQPEHPARGRYAGGGSTLTTTSTATTSTACSADLTPITPERRRVAVRRLPVHPRINFSGPGISARDRRPAPEDRSAVQNPDSSPS